VERDGKGPDSHCGRPWLLRLRLNPSARCPARLPLSTVARFEPFRPSPYHCGVDPRPRCTSAACLATPGAKDMATGKQTRPARSPLESKPAALPSRLPVSGGRRQDASENHKAKHGRSALVKQTGRAEGNTLPALSGAPRRNASEYLKANAAGPSSSGRPAANLEKPAHYQRAPDAGPPRNSRQGW
jgi:hypothetical protein